MRRAIELARRGRPHPNPLVGAVVARGGRIAGEGYHRRRGFPHAEVVALRRAGSATRGATLVVTLEPCAHHGLTPPCAEAILAAGIRRVVVGARDPDPRVRGRGLRRLRRAGVEVEVGVLGREAAALNEAYYHYLRSGRPLVELKLAASLDGRLALKSGAARWITGTAARRQAHRLRAAADAVLVGAGTVRQDDPALTVRHVRGPQPVRVILSGRLDLPERARVLAPGRAPTWVLTGRAAAAGRKARRLRARGVEVLAVPGRAGGRLDLAAALRLLAARGVRRLLVEGGVELATALLASRLADRLHVHVAPVILGGEHRGWPGPLGVRHLTQGLRLAGVRVRRLGDDIEVVGELAGRRRAGRRPR